MMTRLFSGALILCAGFGVVTRAQWTACSTGSTTCAVGANVGIGTTSPLAPFEIAAATSKLSPYTATREFRLTFPDATPNQKIDLYMTGGQDLTGSFDVSIADTFYWENATGMMAKRFYVGVSGGGSIAVNESRVIDTGGLTANKYLISDLYWDAASSRYKITIFNLTSRGNFPVVRMTAFLETGSSNFLNFTPGTAVSGSPASSTRQLVEYRNSGNQMLLAAGTSAAPTIGSLAQSSLGINFPGGGNAVAFTTASGAEMARISSPGTLSIGTQTATCGAAAAACRLVVAGAARAQEVVVDTGWSDYVFAPGYRLAPLADVAAYVKQNQHLPGIPSAAEVAEKGVSLGDMQAKLLAKIEELTLHMIEAEKENVRVRERVTRLEAGDTRGK